MISRNTMTNVSLILADRMFMHRCDLMDAKIENSLKKAFKDERISQIRMNRIVDKFCDNMVITKEDKLNV